MQTVERENTKDWILAQNLNKCVLLAVAFYLTDLVSLSLKTDNTV